MVKRQARRDLVGGEPERHQAEQGRERHAGEDRRDHAEKGVVGAEAGGEADRRPDDHHALDAEVEHAGALDDEFAERREQAAASTR